MCKEIEVYCPERSDLHAWMNDLGYLFNMSKLVNCADCYAVPYQYQYDWHQAAAHPANMPRECSDCHLNLAVPDFREKTYYGHRWRFTCRFIGCILIPEISQTDLHPEFNDWTRSLLFPVETRRLGRRWSRLCIAQIVRIPTAGPEAARA